MFLTSILIDIYELVFRRISRYAFFFNIFFVKIMSLQQSTAGQRPTLICAYSEDLQIVACIPQPATLRRLRHSTWPGRRTLR